MYMNRMDSAQELTRANLYLCDIAMTSVQDRKCTRNKVLTSQQQQKSPSKHAVKRHAANPDANHAIDFKWWCLFVGVSVLALATRLYKIAEPDHVCWDETHFGKMGSWYINGTFFFDVHPPLGKMLIGLGGHITGYNGNFSFSKPGDKYGDTAYIGMRVMCVSLGASLAPMCYCIAWLLSESYGASVLASVLVIFDTGVLTLTQYILLDPILMFFIMAATFSWLKFQSTSNRPFSVVWWLWLSSTGVCLACSIGVKFVGLFVILLAGLSAAGELWQFLGNVSMPMVDVVKHFLARALCLIVLPVLVYTMFFFIHFKVLTRSGSGDGFFSSSFQSQLRGNALYNTSMPQHVSYGSVITLKNHRTAGAYLHSHWHLYPEGIGAQQQQVTTYWHKDENNRWLVKQYNIQPKEGDNVKLVKNGDLVRLEHVPTRRNLHSHREVAPLTKQHYQVTCYGQNGTGDLNDVFRVSIPGIPQGEPLRTVRSVFRLLHHSTGCAVQSHNKQLPKWGWEQMEVSCNPNSRDKHTLWNVEEVSDLRLPNISFQVYSPSFLEKLIESHAVMTQGNKGLKPKQGEVTSRPWQWPLNYKGQPFSGGDYRVYLLGNPVIWWGNLCVLAVFILYSLWAITRHRRKQAQVSSREKQIAVLSPVVARGGWLLLGWALHYLPFWTMTRVLYFHHYFPAFLYSCLLSGVFLDHVIDQSSRLIYPTQSWMVYHSLYGILLSAFAYSFLLFSPVSYGMRGHVYQNQTSAYTHLKWLQTWDI